MPKADGAREALLLDATEEGDALERVLEAAGCVLHRVADVPGAESILGGIRPDLVVLGLEAEGALTLCDLIRALPRGGSAAVVLIGGPAAEVHSAADAILRGADAYLHRPVSPSELIRKVESLLGPLRDPRAEPAFEPALEADEPEPLPHREPTLVLAEGSLEPAPPGLAAPGEATAETELRELDAIRTRAEELGGEPGGSRASTGPAGRGPARPPGPPWSGADRDEPHGLGSPPSGLGPLDPSILDGGVEYDEDAFELRDYADDHVATGPGTETDPSDSEATPPRPERTHVLPAERRAAPARLGPVSPLGGDLVARGGGADAELSDDFRRVIDEVAQRLFPEAPSGEYDDGFDELRTVVPALGDPHAADDDLDEYSLDSMETFAGSEGGLTLSLFDEVTKARVEEVAAARAEEDEVQTGVEATRPKPGGPVEPVVAGARVEAEPAWEAVAGGSRVPPPAGRPEAGPALAAAGEPVPVVRLGEQAVSGGSLAEHPVPVLLAACTEGGVRARLVIREQAVLPPRERVVVFEDGRPVLAASTVPSDRLIEMLRVQGRLTASQYERCQATVALTGRRPGAVLVELGLARPDELLPLVRWHFCEIVYAAFSVRQGTFRLEPLSPGWRPRIAVERSASALVLEGLRRRYGAEELEALLGGPEARPRRRLAPLVRAPDGVLPEEEGVLPLCDGSRSLLEVVGASGLARGQVLAVLYGLALLGHLERAELETLPRLSAVAHDRAVHRALLEERIAQSREADYFTLLGLAPEASAWEVRLAHERRKAELAPERVASAGASDLEGRLSDVRYALDEAVEILGDDRRREAYRRARFG